jgi:hypothetical protein
MSSLLWFWRDFCEPVPSHFRHAKRAHESGFLCLMALHTAEHVAKKFKSRYRLNRSKPNLPNKFPFQKLTATSTIAPATGTNEMNMSGESKPSASLKLVFELLQSVAWKTFG